MSTRYRFDRFEFFLPGTRQLLMDGAPVALGARTFDFLLCLVKGPTALAWPAAALWVLG